MPSRPPDVGNDGLPPTNVMRHVSLPTTETGLRAVPTFRAEPTEQNMVATTNHILTDLNMMLSRELAGLKTSVQKNSDRLEYLQMRQTQSRSHGRSQTPDPGPPKNKLLTRRRQAMTPHPQPALVGWDPEYKVAKKFGQHSDRKPPRAKTPGVKMSIPNLTLGK